MAYLDFSKGGITRGVTPSLAGEFGDVLGRPNLDNILGDGGYQEMLRRTSPAPRKGPVPETQIDRMVKALTGTNPSKPANIVKQSALAKNFPSVANAGKNISKFAKVAGPYVGALTTGITIGDIANKVLGRPTLGDALQTLSYRNPDWDKPTLRKLSKEEIARLPESIKQGLINDGLGYVIGAEDNEVASLTNELKQAKQPTATKPSAIAKNAIPKVLRDASGNVMLPSLPSTSPTGDLPDISTVIGNADGVSQLDGVTGDISNNGDKLDKLLELYNKRLELNKPYLEQLQNYTDNYRELQRQAYLRDVQRAGINDYIHGTNTASQLLGKYNPAEIEATRLDLMNKLLQTQSGELGGADELIGRAALAEAAGLPIEAALADKDTFKAMSPIMSSINALRGKTYSTDVNSRTKLQIAKMNLEGMLQRAKMAGDVRLQVAATSALANVNRALINSMGFSGATASDIGNVYNQLGYTPIDVSELQGNDLDAIINSL